MSFMLEKSFGLLFYLKQTPNYKKDQMYIYLRITVDGVSKEISTKRLWFVSKWNVRSGRAEGTNEEARSINNMLDTLQVKAHEAKRMLIDADQEISAQGIKNLMLGVDDRKMILEVFQEHNDQVAALVPQEYSAGTLDLFKRTLNHTRSFIQWKYRVDDLDIKKLNYEFISQYSFWLKSVRKCQHNSAMKYLTYFKKTVLLCVKYGWLKSDPFAGFNLNRKEVEKPYLTEDELKRIISKDFRSQRLSNVRDIFVFCCYTGLAYIDAKQLKSSELVKGFDGEQWIIKNRQKTESASRIPLLPAAQTILDKYKADPQCQAKDAVLPMLTNQKMNEYLKEIAERCDIDKLLTFHVARHTFATTVTLSNGVPMETVSKMLGHKNLRQTQHYAKIVDAKVAFDMKQLKDKLSLQG
ncbi:site-specific integrase [Mucilaginibacter phenanthrenivorans]|uniref:site-specific integrase n=1 Tax=Mucilaginibacter phenanthrenivorans TaxID=1234842 RepID=UPI002156FBB2|nr:site-specific integrase [Mucilaginibacter phenanthrenivorans]